MTNLMGNKHGIRGVQLRMPFLTIRNNTSSRRWWQWSKPELCCITLIIEDTGARFNGYISMDVFPDIDDDQYLDVDKLLYTWEGTSLDDAPNRLFVISAVVKSKSAVKDTALIIKRVKEDECYKQLTHSLSSVIPETASFPLVVSVSMKIMDVVKKYLGKAGDAHLASTANYVNKHHGDLDKPGIFPLSRATQNAYFNFDLYVYKGDSGESVTNTIVRLFP